MSTNTVVRRLSADAFKRAFRNHAAGVAIITADAGNGPVGLTATSVFSVSAEPALLVFSVSDDSSSARTLRKTKNVVIHLLSADQADLAKLCAKSGVDRFADTSLWDRLPSGEPYFPTAQAWILGRVVNRMPAGGATVLAVHALEASEPEGDFSPPLVYHNRRWHSLGDHSTLTV
jgi:flavin reductase (DIM6/NTAB) family NADH-FMN oxidoreductase RutF